MSADETELEDRLSAPSSALVAEAAYWPGDMAVLGAGGKMGPTLCRMARRAADEAGRRDMRIFAVSRWSDAGAARRLKDAGVEPIEFALSADADFDALPDAQSVVYMVGVKFGAADRPFEAWAANAVLPALTARRYAESSIAAFSTGNVYPFTTASSGGSTEDNPPDPVGEYAMSCLGRERVFEHAAHARGTRVALLRLNYAVEPRYGVLADVARAVHAGERVDLTTAHVNVVWQRYANEVALRCLNRAANPPLTLNVTGPEIASARQIATALADLLGTSPRFRGEPQPTALLNNAALCHSWFGYPDVPLGVLIEQQARWVADGGVLWDKPTKYQRRDGKF
ncbi:MAG: NAD-dependent epimerase/dehydratase family protein [Stackebrandtia sp.]